ncbi:hypothetical protein AB0H42_23425 [Nocardia sp. NPDC050799]|uniref:hypothetical protein n=1 Tax=Nocardia sp. NPDC050799 TaxID=3154842 RepID=UPI0033E1A24F
MTDNDVPGTVSAPGRATLFDALRVAARAPSVHNTQPRQWVYRDGRLYRYRDDERLLTSADPTGRQLVISMLHHARAAFAAAGWRTGVTGTARPGLRGSARTAVPVAVRRGVPVHRRVPAPEAEPDPGARRGPERIGPRAG